MEISVNSLMAIMNYWGRMPQLMQNTNQRPAPHSLTSFSVLTVKDVYSSMKIVLLNRYQYSITTTT